MSYLVNAIGHVQLNVVDIEAMVKESNEILGLHVTRQSDEVVWLSSNGRDAELVLHRASENSVRSVGLEAVSRDAIAEAVSRVEGAGCRLVSQKPSLDCCEAGMSFATPQGHLIELHTPIADDINARRHFTRGVGLLHLDHVNITSPDPVETRAQFEQILGLKLSERMANDALSWMRGANLQHHLMGIVRGPTGLHHYAFEVSEFGDYCQIGDRLDKIDKEVIWGPGRHRAGDNTFFYYIDACGCIAECSGEMSMINDDDRYVPNVITNLERPGNVRVMNVWGWPAPQPWLEHKFLWAKLSA